MREARENNLLEFVCLRANGLGDFRMGMALGVNPPGRNEIEIFTAVCIEKLSAFTADNRYGIGRGLSLGKGMPNQAFIGIDDFFWTPSPACFP